MTPWKRASRLLPVASLALMLAAGPALLPAQESGEGAKPTPEAAKKAADAKKKQAEGEPETKEEAGTKTAEAAAAALRTEGEVISQQGDLDIAVDANFFSEFPGFDLSTLSEAQRTVLLQRANHVYCTCGCRGDTVARCVVLDPTCQTARKMLQAMLDKVEEMTPEEAAAIPAPEPPAQP